MLLPDSTGNLSLRHTLPITSFPVIIITTKEELYFEGTFCNKALPPFTYYIVGLYNDIGLVYHYVGKWENHKLV